MNTKTTTARGINHKTRGLSVVLRGGKDNGFIVKDVKTPTVETPFGVYKKTDNISENGYNIYNLEREK